jgi:Sigma-54 interaction domain
LITQDPWDLAIRSRAPILLVGPGAVTTRVLTEIEPWMIEPVVRLRCRPTLELPGSEPIGTVVFEDVHQLDEAAQAELLDWMDNRRKNTLVISTSAHQLIDPVRTPEFLEPLYYRLNVLYVNLELVAN